MKTISLPVFLMLIACSTEKAEGIKSNPKAPSASESNNPSDESDAKGKTPKSPSGDSNESPTGSEPMDPQVPEPEKDTEIKPIPDEVQVKPFSIPVGIENVNDSPLKAAAYQTLLRFVPKANYEIDRVYFGFKLKGATCHENGSAAYGKGDGGTINGTLVSIDPTTGLPAAEIAHEAVNGCQRYNEAFQENGSKANPVLVWITAKATLQAGKMYGLIIKNAHADPANNFFSFNMPLADTTLAGPHARNELNASAKGSILGLDPREHVAWSKDNGGNWSYGSANGQYSSYVNDDKKYPATRMPQYGLRLTGGKTIPGQPYYAYSDDCVDCTVAYGKIAEKQEFSELGGFLASGTNVGTLTISNSSSGAQASCTPAAGYGFRTCKLPAKFAVEAGQVYTIHATGSVEIMKLDYSQRLLFPEVGSDASPFRAYQPNPKAGTNAKDVPSLWASP